MCLECDFHEPYGICHDCGEADYLGNLVRIDNNYYCEDCADDHKGENDGE